MLLINTILLFLVRYAMKEGNTIMLFWQLHYQSYVIHIWSGLNNLLVKEHS